ncbi:hypothetical protein niasHT_024864 [Heterodera trifolii]|uniref:Ubiquitin-like domain-containing protein n=1 Tax=Heterodera trifolii TaxID=157864 RepID=A0ABD2JGD1_9BILA
MSHLSFSLLHVGISVVIITIMTIMIPSLTDGMKIKVKSRKNIPKKGGEKMDILARLKTKVTISSASAKEHTTITVDLKYEKTVAALKEAIEEETGIPCEYQLIRHNSSSRDVLKDEETLGKGGLENAEVFLAFGELEILVKYGTESFAIRVNKSDTVATLKKAIKERFGISTEKQKLRRRNRPDDDNILENSKTMNDSQIVSGSNVFLSLIYTLKLEIDGVNKRMEDKMKDITVEVEGTDSVATLEKKITNKIKKHIGINIELPMPNTLRLDNKFGFPLEDTKTMDIYKIEDGQTILLSLGEFQINVRYGTETHSVNVKDTDTVATLKRRIENIKEFGNIPPEEQALRRFNRPSGNILENSKTMNDYLIVNGTTVFMSFIFTIKVETREPLIIDAMKDKGLMKNNMETIVFAVEVEGTDSVATLKKKIGEATGRNFRPFLQTLRLNNAFGFPLENTKTMDFYEIKDGQLVLFSMCEFKINVKYGRKSFLIDVKKTDIVATVKRRIENIEEFGNIPPEKQMLSKQRNLSRNRRGIVLDNDNDPIDYYSFENEENVILSWNEFEISVKYEEKEPVIIKFDSDYFDYVELKGNDTVKNVKEKIKAAIKVKWDVNFEEEGSKMELYKSVVKILDKDNKTMDEYGIKEGNTIYGKFTFRSIKLSEEPKSKPAVINWQNR